MQPHLFLILFLLRTSTSWEWNIPPVSGDSPSARAGHTMSALSKEDKSVLCGGQKKRGMDIAGCYVLSPLENWNFKQVIGETDTAPRSDHTALVYQSNMTKEEVLILYGGISNKTMTRTRSLGKYNDFDDNGCEVFSTMSWSKIEQADCDVSNAPASRLAHSATLVGEVWVIFGGLHTDGSGLDNVIQGLDLINYPQLQWRKGPSSQIVPFPPPRAYHAAATFKNTSGSYVIISGGQGLNEFYRDIWIFGPIKSGSRLVQGKWSSPKLDDFAPILFGHKVVLVGATLFSFGGSTPPASGVYTLDMSVLDETNSLSWVALKSAGTSPLAMFRSSITSIDADGSADLELLIFGGATVESDGSDPVCSGTLSVLTSAEGGNFVSRLNIGAILGGSTAAVIFIGIGLWFLLKNSNKSRSNRLKNDAAAFDSHTYQTSYLIGDYSETFDDSEKEEEELDETLKFY